MLRRSLKKRTMKFLILIIVQVALALDPSEAADVKAAAPLTIPRIALTPAVANGFCVVGTVVLPPVDPKPLLCPTNEVYGCAYGELRCDGRLFCGTPPCYWKCWCKSGFKRNNAGICVKSCPLIAFPAILAALREL